VRAFLYASGRVVYEASACSATGKNCFMIFICPQIRFQVETPWVANQTLSIKGKRVESVQVRGEVAGRENRNVLDRSEQRQILTGGRRPRTHCLDRAVPTRERGGHPNDGRALRPMLTALSVSLKITR
jgi:hypothetical protein